MQIDLGKLKMDWRGPYDNATEYEKDDAVSFSGSSYIYVGENPSTGVVPTAGQSTGLWHILAAGMPTMNERGEIVFQGESGPVALAPGFNGHVLTSRGPGADPEWAAPMARRNSRVIKLPDTDHMNGSYRSGGFITADNSLRVWGHGENGNLGQGSYVPDRSFPIQPAMPRTDATVVVWRRCGEDNWVVMSDGSVYVWGRNSYGSLGVGNTANVLMPTKVTALDGVNIVDIAVGHGYGWSYNHAMFLADDGTMYACGYNGYGQLGLGDGTNRNVPTALAKTDWDAVFIAGAQYGRTFAIDSAGNLWAWGFNGAGPLGLGDTSNRNTPTQVTLPSACASVSCCQDDQPASGVQTAGHTLALLDDGSVYSWGNGNSGQLGVGNNSDSSSPQHIASLGTDNVAVFAAGGDLGYSVVQKADGTIRTFGYNAYGQLGSGNTTNANAPITPVGVEGRDGIKKVLTFGGNAYGSVAVLFEDGSLMCTGYNGNGNLGVGNTANQTTFQDVRIMQSDIVDICCVGFTSEVGLGILTDDGLYYQTGYAGESQLPEDDDEYSTVPFLVTC